MKVTSKDSYPINIDNRISTGKAQSGIIEYPSAMAVKWAVDTEEWGFWTSVPPEWRNDRDWAEHGDYGYDDIQLDPYGAEVQEVSNDWSYRRILIPLQDQIPTTLTVVYGIYRVYYMPPMLANRPAWLHWLHAWAHWPLVLFVV